MLCGKPREHLVLRVAPRTCFLGSAAPKKNKRGKRSKQKQEERVLKGPHKRQEAQQARAEARFPELLGRSNSTEGQARTVVLKGDSVEKPKKRVRRTERRHRGVVLKERVAGSPAPVAAGSTAPQEKKRRRRRRRTLQGVPRIQLRSVPRPRQNLNLAGLALSAAKRQWGKQTFRERFAAKQQIRRLLPRGTVAESLLTVPEACSSCDERTAKNRPVASSFALQRLRRSKPLPKLPQAFPEVPDQEILEEEEEEVPLLDSPNRDGSKRPDGDGESTDSEDCNYRSSNQYPAELRAC